MLKLLTAAFLLICSIGFSATPPDISFGKISQKELEMKFYHLDSTAGAVVLGDYGTSRFTYNQNKGIQVLFTRHTRIKILNTQGYQWADVEIPIYHNGSSEEDVTQLKGFTYNLQDGKTEKSKLKSDGKFVEKRSEHWNVIKFTMPNVKEGSVIEYSYTIVSDFLFNLQDWEFQKTIPVAWSEYEVRIPEYFYYKQLSQGYHPLVINETSVIGDNFMIVERERTGGEGLRSGPVQSKVSNRQINFSTTVNRWAAQDMPAMVEEPFMTTLSDYIMKIEFELASTQFPGSPVKNYTTTWENIDKELLNDDNFGDLIKRRAGLKDQVSVITKDKATPEEKLSAIYNFVRDQINWTGTSALNASQSFKQTLEKKSGNSAEVNLLLIGMLREAGITADPVVLSTRTHGILRKSFPMLSQFNYVFAHAKIGDHTFMLDATESSCPQGVLPVRCLNGEGRLVNLEGGEKWIDLMPHAASNHFIMVNLNLDQEQRLIGKVSNSRTQYDALSVRHKIKANHDVEQYITEIKEDLQGWEVKEYNLQDVEEINKPLKEDFEVELTRHINTGEIMYLNGVLAGKMTENPFKLEERLYPVDFAYPHTKTYMLNLTLPEGYVFEEVPVSAVIALPNQGGTYSYATKVIGNTIQILSKLEIKKSRFLVDEYPYLREFFDLVVAKQGEQLVIRKNK